MDDSAARQAVERAEREPLLGHRAAPVRAAIDAAAPLLDATPSPELRARLLLRLAQVAMVETDYEAADQALAAAARHAPDAHELRMLGGVRACRVAIRRGPDGRAVAEPTLRMAAEQLAPGASAVAAELALAIGELELHAESADAAALDALAELRDAPDLDTRFTAHQLVAAHALARGDLAPALASLRAVVAIARDAASPADEIEARIALAAALAARGDAIASEDAAHQVAAARQRAKEHGLAELEHAALLAEAALLADARKTAPAIDRVLELARAAAAKQDAAQYVAAVGIMAELYARSGDHVSAFRTIAESHHALSRATGSDTTPLFRPLLARLRDRIGEAKLTEIAAAVEHANRLADQILDSKKK
ncbi:MAG TPA: hypothetical protein VMJ10_24545 [Kofleriaceae bacterium]|nr:hypothetical protein [Kofleriaceae bacterium]